MPSRRGSRGFTILEAIVAVTIVGVTAVASLAAFGSQLRCMAIERGMRTLREDGLRQVQAGITTVEEVLRVTQG